MKKPALAGFLLPVAGRAGWPFQAGSLTAACPKKRSGKSGDLCAVAADAGGRAEAAIDIGDLGGHARGQVRQQEGGDVADLLDWVGLGDRKHVYPPVLSGGEKQRAAIARALITKPEFLLADEPTGNVDPPLARRLLRLFLELNRLGTAVLIATHDIGLMDQLDARRMVIEGGHLEIYE